MCVGFFLSLTHYKGTDYFLISNLLKINNLQHFALANYLEIKYLQKIIPNVAIFIYFYAFFGLFLVKKSIFFRQFRIYKNTFCNYLKINDL